MTVRFADEKDIPQINSLLYQVATVHHNGRPDLFKGGAKNTPTNRYGKFLRTKKRLCLRQTKTV